MNERDIFIAALQKEDPTERRAYLDEACAGQPELRKAVEELLRLNLEARTFLQQPAARCLSLPVAMNDSVSSLPRWLCGLLPAVKSGASNSISTARRAAAR